MIPDFDMREIDLYSFKGLMKHEGKEKFGAAFHQWQVDPPNFIIDGHFPVRELWTRARSCWDRILSHQSKSVLVVAHNAVNQALVATAIGALVVDFFRLVSEHIIVKGDESEDLDEKRAGMTAADILHLKETISQSNSHNMLQKLSTTQANCHGKSLPYATSGGQFSLALLQAANTTLPRTPSSPIAAGSSGGRKASKRIILVCHGSLANNESQKTAELLLDLKINSIVSSPGKASLETAELISKVQEAADCLGADCVPRYVDIKEMKELDVETMLSQSRQGAASDSVLQPNILDALGNKVLSPLWNQTRKVWQTLLDELSDSSEAVVAVGHPVLHVALITHCLNLSKDLIGSFHLDGGSISVIDFPDGPTERGVIRCINYTAHLGRWSILSLSQQ
ncbi:putative 2-carboxy-D-arabinitol-1-phosphatase [Bienertia sinuspersici]